MIIRILSVALMFAIGSLSFAADKATSKKKSTPAESSKKASGETSEKKISAAAQKAADSLTSAESSKLLEIINKGEAKELTSLPGIGGTRAAAVKKARPLKTTTDLLSIEGIGETTFEQIVAHAKAGFPSESPEKKPAGPAKGKKKKTTPTKGKE
jgi:DNA uptake protein ComE-like DNA-binding protein